MSELDVDSSGGMLRSNAVLAVDLGASNVKTAWLSGGRPTDSSERRSEFPAAVACRDGELVVGDSALEIGRRDPAASLLQVREWLGLVPSVTLAGSEFTIETAVAALFREAAARTIHTTTEPSTVIVHPAPWPRRRIELLSSCARDARLDVVGSIPDAIAVAGLGPLEGDVLVIDVGSALTASIVDLDGSPARILWSRSNVGAGGEAIAQAIQAVSEVGADRARELARGAPPEQSEELRWGRVEEQAQPGVEEAGELIESVLRRADRNAKSINRVYVTGGSSVAPFVLTALETIFDVHRIFPVRGASAGAARGALRLLNPVQPTPTPQIRIDPTPAPPQPQRPRPVVKNMWEPNRIVPGRSDSEQDDSLSGNLNRPWTRAPTDPLGVDEPSADVEEPVHILAADATPTRASLLSEPSPEPDSLESDDDPVSTKGPSRHRRLLIVVAIIILVTFAVLALVITSQSKGDGSTPTTAHEETSAPDPWGSPRARTARGRSRIPSTKGTEPSVAATEET